MEKNVQLCLNFQEPILLKIHKVKIAAMFNISLYYFFKDLERTLREEYSLKFDIEIDDVVSVSNIAYSPHVKF